jgi:hypothetical protein
LLILGVFAMLYVRERRLWVWLARGTAGRRGGGASAGSGHGAVEQPQDLDVDREFELRKTNCWGVLMNTATTTTNTTTLTLGEGFLSKAISPAQPGSTGCSPRWSPPAACTPSPATPAHGRLREGHPAGAMPAAIWLGWFWRPLRVLMVVVSASRCWASPPTRATWRGPTGVLAEVLPLQPVGHPVDERAVLHEHDVLLARHVRPRQADTMEARLAPGLGGRRHGADRHHGALVRKLPDRPDIGHIPVSNLYEVFVLFCWMTAAFYLYFEEQYGTRALGAFVMLVVSAAVGFLLWYTVVREAHEIQPLVPASRAGG